MPESFNQHNRKFYYARLVFEITFFLVINVVLLNIIFGIIIDTFAELREKNNQFEFDSKNVCFVCNLEKYKFEKVGIRFKKHTSLEHNIWDYVNFLIFMKNKTLKDCNGIELELLNKI